MPSPIRLISIGLTLGLLLACGTTDTVTTTPDAVTLIAIDPTYFPMVVDPQDINAPQCRSGSGAYVAELIDVSQLVTKDSTKDIGQFVVQASPTTLCSRTVAFGEVVGNREYVARITTYSGDVCTIARTSITVPLVDGACPDTLANATALAQPTSTIFCYGWRASGSYASVAAVDAAGSAGAAGDTGAGGSAGSTAAASADGGNLARCDPQSLGCPAAAVDYRTVKLPYCVLSPN